MGIFSWLFGKAPEPTGRYQGEFKMLNGYSPHFSSWNKDLYESELIRAAIGVRATHISKLKVEIQGAARPALQRKLSAAPNEMQTWSQFLARLSTIFDLFNNAFIVPVYDQFGEPSGIYAPLPERCEVVQYGKTPYLKYTFADGQTTAIELAYCGVLVKHQLRSDFFGENNSVLQPTMDLIHIQNQGIEEAVKNTSTFRFMGTLANFAKPEDLAKERLRFTRENLSTESESGGFLLFPNTYKDIKQIDVKPYTVDPDQMKQIRENVYNYFGVNEDVLQNKAFGDSWLAFYEGAIEPFAIQFSEAMTKALFTERERAQGTQLMATANRLQYMSNRDKLNVTAQLLDRGLFSLNEAREIWNLPPVENGDQRVIRGEYYSADEKLTPTEDTNDGDQEG